MLRTLFITLFAVFGLIACESGFGKTVVDGPPGGFATRISSSKLIFVVPIEGLNGPARLVLADAIAASLRDVKSPAIISEYANEKGPTVAGKIIAAEKRGSVVWVTALWELLTPYGTAVAEYRHQIVVDSKLWETGSAEAINLLISDAGPRVAGMVRDFVSPMDVPVSAPVVSPVVSPGPSNETAGAPAMAPVQALLQEGPVPRKITPVAAKRLPVTAKAKPKSLKPAAGKASQKTRIKAKPAAVAVLSPAEAKSPGGAGKKRKEKPKASKPMKPLKLVKKSLPPSKGKRKPVLMPIPDERPSRIVPDPPPVAWDRPSFLIKPVKGAPGDGNKALTKAMKKALRKRDITVTEDPRQAGFVIEGHVEISPAVGGRQQARIVWSVNTIAGDEVGKAVQENAVKAGSLNGPWGRVADIVTNAAVIGIQELFGVEEKRSFRKTPEPKFSGNPALPQVPGRAMPPPK